MSTLTSSDFGELKRPTTRVHAPPGGGSNWSIGGAYDTPTPTAYSRTIPPPIPQQTGFNPYTTPQAPIQQQQQLKKQQQNIQLTENTLASSTMELSGISSRIAIIKVKSHDDIVNQITNNCINQLQLLQVDSTNIIMSFVYSIEELPFAASQILLNGGFDAIICTGFLSTSDPLFPAHSTIITQSFVDLSTKFGVPIVRGIFIGEPANASAKAKNGWGSEAAKSAIHLAMNFNRNKN